MKPWSVVAFAIPALLGSTPAQGAPPDLPRPPPTITEPLDDPPLFGDKDGLVFFRDPLDYIRLYPHATVSADGHGFLAPQIGTLQKSVAGADLGARFFLREARLSLGGEIIQRFAFDVGLNLVANPAIDGARADGTRTVVALSDAWASTDQGRGLLFTAGYYQMPFSIENRTAHGDLPMLERNLAIRGFVVPGGQVLGASVSGVALKDVARWDLGVFGAESWAPGDIERSMQYVGRVRVLPFAPEAHSPIRGLQIGMSARLGWRNPRDSHEDIPAINTNQGFALFKPTFEQDGRTVHVVPDGAQWAIGPEFRLPVQSFVFTSEAYWVTRHTSETIEGRPRDVERLGSLEGWGWYVQLSCWILQALKVIDGEPPSAGEYPHPEHLELANLPPKVGRYGIELAVIGAGVNGQYLGASRAGTRSDVAATNIEAYQIGGSINYWQTSRFRASFSYNAFYVPRSGSDGNLLVVPSNIAPVADLGTHTIHEVGGRVSVMF
ncbi:MAG TPA: porin [Polyangiaceae bacterium]|jgi:hypothetical protein|nr:porin [Polyangiaceae bacterium]